MKIKLLPIAFLLIAASGFSQTIYKGLDYGMSKDEAVDTFRADRDEYTTVDIGNGVKYRIYQQNFVYEDDKLVGVVFNPKGAAFGQSYDEAVIYLDYTRSFLEGLGYTVFSEPEYWNAPLNFKSKYGLLMVNPDKTAVAQLYPTSTKAYNHTTFLVLLKLYNYDTFMKWHEKEVANLEEKAENSGF